MYPINGTTFSLSTHPLVVKNIYGQYQVRLALHDIDCIEIYLGSTLYCTIPNFVRDEPIVASLPAVYTAEWPVPFMPGQTYAVVHYWRQPVSPIWQEQ
jgi:hypothetical protein